MVSGHHLYVIFSVKPLYNGKITGTRVHSVIFVIFIKTRAMQSVAHPLA